MRKELLTDMGDDRGYRSCGEKAMKIDLPQSDPRVLACRILALPGPTRERMLRLVLAFASAPKQIGNEVASRIESDGHRRGDEAIDRIIDTLERSQSRLVSRSPIPQ